MNVLFVNHTAFVSGAEIVLINYLKTETRIKKFFYVPEGDLVARFKDVHCEDIYIAKKLGPLERKNKKWFLRFLKQYIISSYELIKIIKTGKIELIYANTFTAAVYCLAVSKITGLPLIWHMHDIFKHNSFESKVARIIGKHASSIIAVSNAVKDYLISLEIQKEKINVVYNSIDYEKDFNPNNYEVTRSEKIIICMFGLVTEWKGTHVLLKAIAAMEKSFQKKIHVKIIGEILEDVYYNELKEIINKYKLNSIVEFLGKKDNIAELMLQSDIIVHASTWHDPLPTVLIEGLAMEKFVVASNVGGVPEIIQDGKNGFIYNRGNSNQLSELLSKIITLFDSEQLNEIKKNTRKETMFKFNSTKKKDSIYSIFLHLKKSS